MAVLDTDILSEVQAALVETVDGGATVSSGLWTVAEFNQALDQSQLWLVRESMLLINEVDLAITVGNPRNTLPSDWLITRRVVWQGINGIKELPRDSTWSASMLQQDWETVDTVEPLAYSDYDTPPLQLTIMPATTDATASAVLMYVPRTAVLSNTGVATSVPDACVPCLKWRTIALLLGKEGRGQDAERAEIAQQLAEESMMALVMMMKGWN